MCDGRSCLSDFKFHIIWNPLIVWAISSAGRALRSQRRGREFEPLIVHQYSPAVVMIAGLFYFLASKSSSIASFQSALKGFIVSPIVNRVCSIDSEMVNHIRGLKKVPPLQAAIANHSNVFNLQYSGIFSDHGNKSSM